MRVKITEELTITTNHPSSCYGMPVVVDKKSTAYGLEDIFPQSIYSWGVTVREVFEGQLLPGARSLLSPKQISAIEKFLGK